MTWLALESLIDLEQIVGSSRTQKNTLAIFKHSTRCAISSMAKSRLEKSWVKYNEGIPIYLLDLIKYRDVSNQIASQLNIVHQSPQLIVIKSGEAVFNSSHISISAKDVSKYS